MLIPKRKNSITLVDVAREAGVSLKTASRVLNKEPSVNSQTAINVQDAMVRLDYRPNELARGLKTRRSAAIGMIVKNLSDPFATSAVKAVEEVARANGYIVILASSGGDADIERTEVESLIRRQIDGLIIAPIGSPRSNFANIIPAGLDVVTFDQPIRHEAFDSVMIDNRRSAKKAVQHLLDHRYRRIVALGTRAHLYTSAQRMAGYRDAMKAAGLEARMGLVEDESLMTAEWISDVVFNRNKADAIVCMNWVCTMRIMRGMRQLGKRLSHDVAFLSFDDFELADMMIPSVSVLRQPSGAFGYEAARLLFERIRGEFSGEKRSLVLSTTLIMRESCGCKPSFE
jgi:LacI family transcriptional regulator